MGFPNGGEGVPHLGKIPTFSRYFVWGASLISDYLSFQLLRCPRQGGTGGSRHPTEGDGTPRNISLSHMTIVTKQFCFQKHCFHQHYHLFQCYLRSRPNSITKLLDLLRTGKRQKCRPASEQPVKAKYLELKYLPD